MVDHDVAAQVERILRDLTAERHRLIDENPMPLLDDLQNLIRRNDLGAVSDDVTLLIDEARRGAVDLSALLDSVGDIAISRGWAEDTDAGEAR